MMRNLIVLAAMCLAAGTARQATAVVDRLPAEPIVERHDLAAVLDGRALDGTVLVYDEPRNLWQAVNAHRADLRLAPASTFKIVSALAALDTGVVADGETVVPWDGVARARNELNRDLDLRTAFAVSAVPHFQTLVRRIGPARMQGYLDRSGYGNADRSGGDDRFWLEHGGLRISPREQVGLLVRLASGDLPFSPEAMAIVREIMINPDEGQHVLRAKTGWVQYPDGRQVGWWVGWIERGASRWFFATALESTASRPDFGAARLAVTRDVLRAVGALK